MTAERFDRKQWSLNEKVVYRGVIYRIRGIDWDCGVVKINDGINKSIEVLFEAIVPYNKK